MDEKVSLDGSDIVRNVFKVQVLGLTDSSNFGSVSDKRTRETRSGNAPELSGTYPEELGRLCDEQDELDVMATLSLAVDKFELEVGIEKVNEKARRLFFLPHAPSLCVP